MTILIPDTTSEDRVKELLQRGTVVERDALEHLAATFEAAHDALEVVRKHEHGGLKALVIMDPDEDALVVLWRQEDEDDVQNVP